MKWLLMLVRNLITYLLDRCRTLPLWYLFCCLTLLVCASIRSAPVYGKLDFLILDSKQWWPEWKPMIRELYSAEDRPVLTDVTTSTVLHSVFNLDTVHFRRLAGPLVLRIEQLEHDNRPLSRRLPFGAYVLLQEEEEEGYPQWRQALETSAGNTERPFHCVVNLRGFTPSWVPWETLHWNPYLAFTSSHYRYHSLRKGPLVRELETVPLENCTVYF